VHKIVDPRERELLRGDRRQSLDPFSDFQPLRHCFSSDVR